MKESFVCEKCAESEDGIKYEISYFILSEEFNSEEARERFGVKIEIEGKGEKRSASIRDITVSRARIDDIVTLLSRNLVTPAGLRDVIEDWLI